MSGPAHRARRAARRWGLGLLPAAALALSGCAYVTLSHPDTGAVTRCGQVPIPPWYGETRARQQVVDEVQCVEDAQRQGYQVADR